MLKLKNSIFVIQYDENNTPVSGFIVSLSKILKLDLPVKTAWSLKKFNQELLAKAKLFEEKRFELIKKHGKQDEKNPDSYFVDTSFFGADALSEEQQELKAKYDAFIAEYNELVNIEEEYSIDKINLPDDVKITVEDALILQEILNLD